MNCNHWQNTKTINKQIGFLEASSVPLTRPGWSLPMRQAVSSSEIRLWCTTPSLIYSCWFAVCIFGCGRVWVCVTESKRDCVCSQPSVYKSGCCCEWCVGAHHVCVHCDVTELYQLVLFVQRTWLGHVKLTWLWEKPLSSRFLSTTPIVELTFSLQFFGFYVFQGFLCYVI